MADQHPLACRLCVGEEVSARAESYLSALTQTPDLAREIAQIEGREKHIPFVSFMCCTCMRYSTFSYAFHRDIAGQEAYRTRDEYYNSLVISSTK